MLRALSIVSALLSVGALSGCVTPPAFMNTPVNKVHYRCANGEAIEVRYFPEQGVAVLVRGGQAMELQQQPAASGFWYSNGPHGIRGKGSELRVETGRMVPLTCQAI